MSTYVLIAKVHCLFLTHLILIKPDTDILITSELIIWAIFSDRMLSENFSPRSTFLKTLTVAKFAELSFSFSFCVFLPLPSSLEGGIFGPLSSSQKNVYYHSDICQHTSHYNIHTLRNPNISVHFTISETIINLRPVISNLRVIILFVNYKTILPTFP